MNCNRSLTRNPTKESRIGAAASTTIVVAAATVASTSTRSGTNVKTTSTSAAAKTTKTTTRRPTRETETAAPASKTVGNTHDTIYKNFISTSRPFSISGNDITPYCCCTPCHISTSFAISSYSSKIYKNNKIAQQQHNDSGGMCEIPTATVTAASPAQAPATAEVMPPLTSMSAEQISLTSRVHIMDNDVENKETTAAEVAATSSPSSSPSSSSCRLRITTAAAATKTRATTSTTTRHLPTAAASSSSSSSSSASATSTRSCCGSSRILSLGIKMPLRRLILTIMAAVVLCMEFTICNSAILDTKLTAISLANSNQSHTPAELTNKSSNINDSLPNLTATSTTLTTKTKTTTTLSLSASKQQQPMLLLSSSPLSATSISTSVESDDKSLKSLESAALIEASSSVSLAAAAIAATSIETAANSVFVPSSLTATTLTHNEPFSLDDFNASSELLSAPTSILNTYDASDLPPLTEAEQAAKDLLTKGFSIPTYLPPFPVFAVADLPAYLNTVSTTTTESPSNHADDTNSLESLLYFDGTGDYQQHHQQHQHRKLQIPRRNSSLAGINNVTVQEGNHAYLSCRIHRLQNKPVSWVRLRDGHIISVDQTTFIADQRFQAIFQDDKEYTWSLQVKYVQLSDEGWYECQASSEPKMSAKVYLKVVVPVTELIGDQSRFVKAGSKVALHCIVRGTLDPPQYIIWYRDKLQINDDNTYGWYTQLDRNIFGNNSHNENTIGSLIIPSVRKMDSGNYTCQPSNSASVSVDLHVLSGEYSASAIMSAARVCTPSDSYLLLPLLLLMLLHNT